MDNKTIEAIKQMLLTRTATFQVAKINGMVQALDTLKEKEDKPLGEKKQDGKGPHNK